MLPKEATATVYGLLDLDNSQSKMIGRDSGRGQRGNALECKVEFTVSVSVNTRNNAFLGPFETSTVGCIGPE